MHVASMKRVNYLIQEEWSGLSKYALSMIRQILLCLHQQAREIALETKDKEKGFMRFCYERFTPK